jgi:hypothetical protein
VASVLGIWLAGLFMSGDDGREGLDCGIEEGDWPPPDGCCAIAEFIPKRNNPTLKTKLLTRIRFITILSCLFEASRWPGRFSRFSAYNPLI